MAQGAFSGSSSTQPSLPYGPSISLADAKVVLAAAEQEAFVNQWAVAIAVVDTGGHLVAMHRMDHTQIGSIVIARQKAETAVNFKRSTKVFEDTLAEGGVRLRVLAMPGVLPLEGGLPLLMGGQIIGAIGVSGVQSHQDGQVALAGAAALAPA